MNRLVEIVDQKRRRTAEDKLVTPRESLERLAYATRESQPRHALRSALANDLRINIIAEFKRRSPSKGLIREAADPKTVAQQYERGGAAAVSVLTEADYFDGSLDDLSLVRQTTKLPLLRKDFIFDEYQLYESAAAGADALLLIVATLTDPELASLRRVTEEELGMDALIEVHTRDEMQRAIQAGANLIGVNNRNLATFAVSLETSVELAASAPAQTTMISESGIETIDHIRRLRAVGYQGFLIGETLMRARHPAALLKELARSPEPPASGRAMVKVKICGITNLDDARAAVDAGADMLGFNFYPASPRYVQPSAARAIIDTMRSANTGTQLMMIGVFVNESLARIIELAGELQLDGVQLHGDETDQFCKELKRAIPRVLLIKALTAHPHPGLDKLPNHSADAIMVDTFDPQLRGGTGRVADWEIAREMGRHAARLFLAGGLSAENVRHAIAAVHPYAVDACSSLETSPGKKSATRMKDFVTAVRTSKLGSEASTAREGK